jgi:hypothetical protein
MAQLNKKNTEFEGTKKENRSKILSHLYVQALNITVATSFSILTSTQPTDIKAIRPENRCTEVPEYPSSVFF